MDKQGEVCLGVYGEHVRKLWNTEEILWAAPWLLSNLHIYCSIYCQRKDDVGVFVWARSGRIAHRLWIAHLSFSWVLRHRKEITHIPTNPGEGASSLLAEEDIKPLLWAVKVGGGGSGVERREKSPHIYYQYNQSIAHSFPTGKHQPSTRGSQPGSSHSPFFVSFLYALKTESLWGASCRHSRQN